MGLGGEDVWSKLYSYSKDQLAPPHRMPELSSDQKLLFYVEPKIYEIVNPSTLQTTTINSSFDGKISGGENPCVWNNSSTKIACIIFTQDYKRKLVLIDVANQKEILLSNDTLENKFIAFTYANPVLLAWDNNDENLILKEGTEQEGFSIVKINIKTKEDTKIPVDKNSNFADYDSKYSKFSNKVYFLDKQLQNIKSFDPNTLEVKTIYTSGLGLDANILLSQDGKYLLTREDINTGFNSLMGDTGKTEGITDKSLLIKIDLKDNSNVKIPYPQHYIDLPGYVFFSTQLVGFHNNNAIIQRIYNYGFSNPNLPLQQLLSSPAKDYKLYREIDSYDLSNKNFTKVFSKTSEDLKSVDFSIEVLPETYLQ